MSEEYGSVHGKIRSLEVHNRKLTLAIGLQFLILIVVLFTGQAARPAKIIEAETFIVIDQDGRRRAVLGQVGREAGLLILDRQGRGRASLVASDSVAQMNFEDSRGGTRLLLTASDSDTHVIQKDANGNNRLWLASTEQERGSYLRILDAQSSTRATIGFFAASGPALLLLDEGERPIFSAPR